MVWSEFSWAFLGAVLLTTVKVSTSKDDLEQEVHLDNANGYAAAFFEKCKVLWLQHCHFHP